ncbi:MAG: MFS transporter, partial [Thermoplasmatales archaeon]
LPWSSWHLKMLLILGGGMLFEGFTLGLGGGTISSISKVLNLTTIEGSIGATSAFLVGELVGAIYLGNLSDRIGRRPLFIASMAIILVGALLTIVSFNFISLALFRAITGFGVGGEFGATIAALQEFMPSKTRGFYTGTGNAVLFDLGGVIASLVAYVTISTLPITIGWKVAFATAVILAATILIARFGLPESPRFLVSHGKASEAEKMVAGVESRIEKSKKVKLGDVNPVTVEAAGSARQSFGKLFGKYKKRLTLAWILNFTETWPYYAAFGVLPFIFTKVFKYPGAHVGLLLAVITLGGVLGVFGMSYLLDTIGRRPVITLSYGIAGVMWVIVGVIYSFVPFYGFIGLLVIVYFFTYAAAGILYVQIGEMFPTDARSSGLGTAIGFGRLGGIIGSPLLLLLLPKVPGTFNLLPIFLITGIVMLVGALSEVVLGPEMKKKSLEEASSLHSEK